VYKISPLAPPKLESGFFMNPMGLKGSPYNGIEKAHSLGELMMD
jgi:hypothetical protein